MITVNMTINNKVIGPVDVDESVKMIDFLHEYLGLTGTKFGCGIGVCHACTIIVDEVDGSSHTERTCINGVGNFNGKKLRTVEGHAKRNTLGQITALSPVQQTFVDHFSFQCGWCTSGFVNESTVLIEKLQKSPIKREDVESVIEETLKDHVCRCSGYRKYYVGLRDLVLSQKGLVR